ncbi:hypothetical protein BKA62DRAFT_615172 [Auriculariales sp. MPI-PUGE-AT-0066]|nr:hypothetical protein BKA62DRAFT_615172 [Auriculariales sp. MPI-PUGE-AT-0066]
MFAGILVLAAALLLGKSSASLSPAPLGRRASTVVLGDGVTPASGSINSNLKWQSATGEIVAGPCPGSTAYPIAISDCYQLTLSANTSEMLDQGHLDSPRQRAEFLTPAKADGEAFAYHWRMYLSSKTGTNSSFFHLMQVISRDSSPEPVVTLDAVNNMVLIKDTRRPDGTKPSIPLDQFTDRTTVHTIKGVYGLNGSLDYRVSDLNGTLLLRYTVTKGDMGSNASVKFGTYRAVYDGMTAVKAAVGDFGLN